MTGEARVGRRGARSRGARWGGVARVASGGLLALQLLVMLATVWVLIRITALECGPRTPGALPRSDALVCLVIMGPQAAAAVVACALLVRARARRTGRAALAALAAAGLGAVVGLGALAYALLLALGC